MHPLTCRVTGIYGICTVLKLSYSSVLIMWRTVERSLPQICLCPDVSGFKATVLKACSWLVNTRNIYFNQGPKLSSLPVPSEMKSGKFHSGTIHPSLIACFLALRAWKLRQRLNGLCRLAGANWRHWPSTSLYQQEIWLAKSLVMLL